MEGEIPFSQRWMMNDEFFFDKLRASMVFDSECKYLQSGRAVYPSSFIIQHSAFIILKIGNRQSAIGNQLTICNCD